MSNYTERKKWFVQRVGKTLFSKDNRCECVRCKVPCTTPMLVRNKEHAEFLNDYEVSKMKQMYFDTKAEIQK